MRLRCCTLTMKAWLRVLKEPLKQILTDTRGTWDVPSFRAAVRTNFGKVLKCRTPALGSEVFGSDSEQKLVHHTCKSRACPSCGFRATVLWQRTQWAALPDIPYTGLTLTMPASLWDFFRLDRRLLKDLSALGAAVIQQWAKSQHRSRVLIMVISHTFGRHLNFNPHLHILVSSGGLNEMQGCWVASMKYDKSLLMQQWRFAVITYLRAANKMGLLVTEKSESQLDVLFDMEEQAWWSTHLAVFKSKNHFLKYAGRYVRRPPIAQYRFTEISKESVRFRTHDHRLDREVITTYRPEDFIRALGEHIHDHYANSVRYFGLLAPRAKGALFAGMFSLLGQTPRAKPQRLSWAFSVQRHFNLNPLLDAKGQQMVWRGRICPTSSSRAASLATV